jgi:hypothetical protein
MLAVLAGLLATQHTTPINLYFDRPAGFLAEVAGAFVSVLLVEIPLLLLFVLYGIRGDAGHLVALVFGVPLAVGVVRAATLLANGVARSRWLNTFLQVAASGATLFLLLVAVNFIFWKIDPAVIDVTKQYDDVNWLYQMMESLWMVLPPVGLAAAFAFARIDNKSPVPINPFAPARAFAGGWGRAFTYETMLLAVALLAIIWVVGRKDIPHKVVNINTTFERLSAMIAPRSESDTFSPRPGF